jgi:hypothetical protein
MKWPIAFALLFVSSMTACSNSEPTSAKKAEPQPTRLEGLYRAAKDIEANSADLRHGELRQLIHTFDTELAIAKDEPTANQSVLSAYNSVDECFHDLLTIWQEQLSQRLFEGNRLNAVLDPVKTIAARYDIVVRKEDLTVETNEAISAIWSATKTKLLAANALAK